MRWIDEGNEMKFFSKQRSILNTDDKHRIFALYNIQTGNVFCCLKIYEDRYEIQVLDFFEPIKNEMYDFIMRDLETDEPYSYDRWILPFFREIKLKELGI
jgi:hypothetical protein